MERLERARVAEVRFLFHLFMYRYVRLLEYFMIPAFLLFLHAIYGVLLLYIIYHADNLPHHQVSV
jgi:hypothetical protein